MLNAKMYLAAKAVWKGGKNMDKITKLHSKLLTDYGNVAYQKLSGDFDLKSIPDKIHSAWYSTNENSFVTIAKKIADKADIDEIEADLSELISTLKDEFTKLTDTGE